MKLLVEKPPMRLGMVKRGHRDLVAHPWLKPIDMTQLVKREGVPPPPFVPNIGSDEDMSNFDPMDVSTALSARGRAVATHAHAPQRTRRHCTRRRTRAVAHRCARRPAAAAAPGRNGSAASAF
jgi:hypothetical protein